VCYSAAVWSDFRRYVREYGAKINIHEFVALLRRRSRGQEILMPKGMTDVFKQLDPQSPEEQECKDLVLAYDAAQIPLLEEKLFAQRQRLADAERALETKQTKKASEDKRIATKKIKDYVRRINDLQRTEHLDRDDRIFSKWYCPVMTMDEDGQLWVTPMRYLCRPPKAPAFFDRKFSGAYNARRDNLGGTYWRGVFAKTHAVVVVTAFFENVKRHDMEHRDLAAEEEEENVVLKFTPGDAKPMPLAALWSHWSHAGEEDLLSFAIVTDEPPEEVAAAGHNRCPVPLKATNVEAWMALPNAEAAEYDGMLEDKHRPYYEHLMAA